MALVADGASGTTANAWRHVAERLLASVPREAKTTVRAVWDAVAMARAEALELADATPALDADDAVHALEKQLRPPRPR